MASPQQLSSDFVRPSSRRVNDRIMVVIMVGLLCVVGAVALAQFQGTVATVAPPFGGVEANRDLLFADAGRGSVTVRDAATGDLVATFPAGEGSFVRGVMRSLVHTRQAMALDVRSAFNLALYADGRLILKDPLTDNTIELAAFGATNSGVFAAMLSRDDTVKVAQ